MSFGGPGMTRAVTSSGGWQKSGAGLGLCLRLGREMPPHPLLTQPHPWGICPAGQLTSCPLHFLLHFTEAPPEARPWEKSWGEEQRTGTNQSTPHCSAHHPACPLLDRACQNLLKALGSEPWSRDSQLHLGVAGPGKPWSLYLHNRMWTGRPRLSAHAGPSR